MVIQDRAIIAIDFPGHGLSSWIPDGMQYFAWDLPRQILAIQEYFKWDKVSLLSHSIGSLASLRFASVFQDNVDFYIGVESLMHDYNYMVENRPKLIQKSLDAEIRLEREPPCYTMEEVIKKWLPWWYLSTRKFVEEESVQHLAKRGTLPSKTDPKKYYFSRDSRLKYILFNPEDKTFVEALIRRLKCRTLYIKAIDSPYATDGYSIELCEILEKSNPKFEMHFVPATHHVHLNNPEIIAPLILNFYKEQHT